MIWAAAEYADQDAGEMVQRLLGGEPTRDLLYRAIQAAAQSTTESKIRTLARALASGAIADDGAVVDESLIVVDAIGQLETPHLRLLEILTTLPDDPAVGHHSQLPWPWRLQQILDQEPNLGNAFDALLAKLTALGMVERFGAGLIDYAEDRIHLSRFGEICMRHLLETGSAADE